MENSEWDEVRSQLQLGESLKRNTESSIKKPYENVKKRVGMWG